jgi:putative ABC transport system permease protein
MPDPSTGSGPGGLQQRIAAAFAGTLIDRDILEELAQHADATYEALRADGVGAEEAAARIDAMIAGWRSDPAALQRAARRAAAVMPPAASRSMFSGALADLIYGVRVLRAQRGAAALTILTIALGVGAVTTLFSVANSVLLRPLSWATGDGLVRVIESRGGRQGRVPGTMMNGPFLAWADAPQTIEDIGAWTTGAVTLTGAGDAARVSVANVSPSLLPLLRAQPLRGRVFAAGEGRDQQWRIAILSQGLWEQRFGARDDIVGGTIVLEGGPATVIGIMPRSFRFPTGDTQMWLPMSVAEVDGPNGVKRGQIFSALARLRPGVSVEQAAAEATARAVAAPDAGLTAMSLFGAKEPIQIALVDANEAATAEVRPAIVILLIAAALLFVTAIANVANMQLARAAARHRELTIRSALGAGTARLSRQLLIENAVVAAAGALLGVGLSAALHRALPSLLPAGFPRADEIAIDGRVLMFAAVIAAVASLAAGVLPVLQARRLDLARALSDGTLASAGSGRGRLATARLFIIASQVAATSVLVIGAVLLTRSFMAQAAADRGYDATNVLTASVPFPTSYSFEQRQQARGRMIERLRERPGITHAAFSSGVPLISSGGFASFNFVTPLTRTPIQAEAMRRLVTPDYFGALGLRLRAGRALSDADSLGAPTAVVVNRSFVRKYLDDMPIEQAVGQSLGAAAVRGTQPEGPATIVGVVDDLRQDSVEAPEQPEMFVNVAQLREAAIGSNSIVIIRTVEDPVAYVEALRSVTREIDPAIALDAVMALEERVGQSLSRPRVYAVLLGGFAAFALLIAGAGLFGVLSFSVTQRSRELAVRAALGASRAGVIAVALRQVGVAIAAGLVIGLGMAVALSNNLAPFLYGVPAIDWMSFGIAPIVLVMVSIAACVMPARRVARTDPVQVLREI